MIQKRSDNFVGVLVFYGLERFPRNRWLQMVFIGGRKDSQQMSARSPVISTIVDLLPKI